MSTAFVYVFFQLFFFGSQLHATVAYLAIPDDRSLQQGDRGPVSWVFPEGTCCQGQHDKTAAAFHVTVCNAANAILVWDKHRELSLRRCVLATQCAKPRFGTRRLGLIERFPVRSSPQADGSACTFVPLPVEAEMYRKEPAVSTDSVTWVWVKIKPPGDNRFHF